VAAHQADLRVEVQHELTAEGAPDDAAAAAAAGLAADIAAQGSEAAHTPRLRALLQYAERVALAPASITEEHLAPMREAGLDDVAIHDAAQAAAYFAYINRVADGLGVELEADMG
jgi:uncharacterized peroxidase-related enzyme